MSVSNLTGRVALITGASSGIGAATAVAFGELGMRVAIGARNELGLAATATRATAAGGEILSLPTDVTDGKQVDELVTAAVTKWGGIDVVVANAGQYFRRPVLELTFDELEASMHVNFYGAVSVVLAALPHMVATGRGHIVLMSTLDGKKGIPPDAPYAAAKHALTGFGDVARQELKQHGIDVTTVLPGRVQTPFIQGLSFHWLSRPVPPERVARAVVRTLRRPRAEVVVPAHTRTLVWSHMISPRLTDRVVRALRLEGWRET